MDREILIMNREQRFPQNFMSSNNENFAFKHSIFLSCCTSQFMDARNVVAKMPNSSSGMALKVSRCHLPLTSFDCEPFSCLATKQILIFGGAGFLRLRSIRKLDNGSWIRSKQLKEFLVSIEAFFCMTRGGTLKNKQITNDEESQKNLRLIIGDVLRNKLPRKEHGFQVPAYIRDWILYYLQRSSKIAIRLLYHELMNVSHGLQCVLKDKDSESLCLGNIAALFSNSETITIYMANGAGMSDKEWKCMMSSLSTVVKIGVTTTFLFEFSSVVERWRQRELFDMVFALDPDQSGFVGKHLVHDNMLVFECRGHEGVEGKRSFSRRIQKILECLTSEDSESEDEPLPEPSQYEKDLKFEREKQKKVEDIEREIDHDWKKADEYGMDRLASMRRKELNRDLDGIFDDLSNVSEEEEPRAKEREDAARAMNESDLATRKTLGTKNYTFKPHMEMNGKNGKKSYYQHICFGDMNFTGKSTEELRFEDRFASVAAPGKDQNTAPTPFSTASWNSGNFSNTSTGNKNNSSSSSWNFASASSSNHSHAGFSWGSSATNNPFAHNNSNAKPNTGNATSNNSNNNNNVPSFSWGSNRNPNSGSTNNTSSGSSWSWGSNRNVPNPSNNSNSSGFSWGSNNNASSASSWSWGSASNAKPSNNNNNNSSGFSWGSSANTSAERNINNNSGSGGFSWGNPFSNNNNNGGNSSANKQQISKPTTTSNHWRNGANEDGAEGVITGQIDRGLSRWYAYCGKDYDCIFTIFCDES